MHIALSLSILLGSSSSMYEKSFAAQDRRFNTGFSQFSLKLSKKNLNFVMFQIIIFSLYLGKRFVSFYVF